VIAVGTLLGVLLIASGGSARATSAAPADLAPERRTPVRMTPISDLFDAKGAPPPVFSAGASDVRRRTNLSSYEEEQIVARAREELTRVTTYDNSYMEISGYPNGDVPSDRGACTDVVVRSLRAIGLDLQQLVHEDVVRDPAAYGASGADARIDHRRIGTMFTFFERRAMALTLDTKHPSAFRPGDVVFYTRTTGNAEHVAVVSDRLGPRGLPLLIQNGGPRPVENDTLDHGKMVGHFRALAAR
jgi:uncharacterized protein YijF (DUF1287 family)